MNLTKCFAFLLIFLASLTSTSGQAGSEAIYPEQKTPREALKFFSASIRAADTKKVRACLFATTPVEGRMADATAGAATSVARLRLAALKRWGDQAAEVFAGGVPTEEEIQRIDSAEEKIDGDKAIVTIAGGPQGVARMQLVRVNSAWKISVAQNLEGQSPGRVEQDIAAMQKSIKIISQLCDEIGAGKFKTHMEAFNAMKKRMKATVAPGKKS